MKRSCSKQIVIPVTGNIFVLDQVKKNWTLQLLFEMKQRDRLKHIITRSGSVKMTHLVIVHIPKNKTFCPLKTIQSSDAPKTWESL